MNRVHSQSLLFAFVMAVAGCAAGEPTSSTLPSLDELAAGWSHGRTDPSCRTTGPRGEYLGGAPGAEYCQWPTVSRGPESGTVGGTRDALMGFTLLTWERTFRDSIAVRRFADSLSTEFTRHGLAAYECPGDGRRWQTPGLGVHLTWVRRKADGRPRVLVQATTLPAALPTFLCPAAPTLPVMPPAVTPRAAASQTMLGADSGMEAAAPPPHRWSVHGTT